MITQHKYLQKNFFWYITPERALFRSIISKHKYGDR